MTANAPATPTFQTPVSTTARTTRHVAPHPTSLRVEGRQTVLRSVRAEWIKLWTLRSTWITSFIAIALTVLFGAGIAIASGQQQEGQEAAKNMITAGLNFGQIVVAVLGALIITGEYASGQIRSSLAAVPHRGRLLLSKAVVLAIVSFLLGSLSTLLSWAISAPFLGEHAGSLTDAHYLGFFWGSGLAYAGIALMTLGLGFLLRSTAGSLTVVTALLFVIEIPLGLMAMKWEWATKIIGLLPGRVAGAVTDPFQLTQTWGSQAGGATSFLEHSHAILVFAAWALIPMLIGWPVFSRRDT